MIEFLRGRILSKTASHVVLDVGGVGYGADVTAATAAALGAVGSEAALHVTTIVREESIALVGFAEAEEQEAFDVLLDAQGVGVRTALSALSVLGIDRLARAVIERDVKLLATIPGVGKKTAERLAIDLEAKMKPFALRAAARAMGGAAPAAMDAAAAARNGAAPRVIEAIAALEALGCKPAIAQRAVERALAIVADAAPTTELIKEALKHRW